MGALSYVRSYFGGAAKTTLNVAIYAATLGKFVLLEGRVSGGIFENWAGRFPYRPRRFARPTTIAEIVDLVKGSQKVRVFGSGHSFNDGVVSEETLVSLDDYSGVVRRDIANKQLTVKGGTRVRKVVKLLLEDGLAFEALPSHDAQSIAGILSTDVHGTGRDWGFVNESVVSLKLIDGNGEVHECRPSDDLFKAAVGGVGAVGIISEVVVQGVDRFNVEQDVKTKSVSYVEKNLDQLLEKNEHLSLYLFPFAKRCRVNTWNNAKLKKKTRFGKVREFARISADAMLAAWVGNLFAYTGLLRLVSPLYGIESGSNLVLESNEAFNRSIYHLHQELEFTIPYEDTFEVLRRFIRLYEERYRAGTPYMILEVRFTPERDRTLIGAGHGRRSTWIDLVCNDSRGFEGYYAAAEALIKEIGARPHLGKFCESFGNADMARLHGDRFERFLDLVELRDPDRKFANSFTRRVFEHGGEETNPRR
jgi:D-arabinono-1,4-lactone oxidase/FAD binding domain